MNNAAPFIKKSINICQSTFVHRPKGCTINSYLHSEIVGFSKKNNVRQLMKSSIGEFEERLAGIKYLKKNSNNNKPIFQAFNLISGETINVNAESILLNHNLPIFDSMEHCDFTDSTGNAAHVRSDLVIEKGYMEFIERQSLIFSWLSKSPGEVVELEHIQNEKLRTKIVHINSALKNLSFYSISILEGIYVIMCVGYGDKAFSVGLGTSWNLETALESSLDEFVMIFESVVCHKVYREGTDHNYKNMYIEMFYSMHISDFLDEISYLLNNRKLLKYYPYEDLISDNQLFNSIRKFKQRFDIDVYVSQMISPYPENKIKIAKVFSPDAFPHINTLLYNPNDFKISEKLTTNIYPNKFKMIPFA
ncbi:YcaO-like family protein [Paenibacillus polymyxa]|uniref:YcaO-like family protein n=1 Tax=Paenibacillus polymyxa TaxID=1406 RepID=UPI001BECA551|nr:YcaO-like family protein [Paenibacillus polymyxa]MBT2285400.1 YcaO-like family protein [Paenibacillus polymyxa]